MSINLEINIEEYYDKAGILDGIINLKKYLGSLPIKPPYSSLVYDAKLRLLDSLYKKIESMEVLQLDRASGWKYVVLMESSGAKVELITIKQQEGKLLAFEKITFAEVKAKLLDCEAYGEMFDVNGGTVRQWIRRGKLPEAVKIGSGWRVSEVCAIMGRSYGYRMYTWDRAEVTFEEEMAFLNDYDGVSLEMIQNGDYIAIPRKNASCGIIIGDEPYKKNPNQDGKIMSAKDKEAFELRLIEHPFVKFRNFSLHMEEN